MPLTGMTEEEIDDLKKQLLAQIPQDGTAIGNIALRNILGWEKDLYYAVRAELLGAGGKLEIGRGKGGSVRLRQPAEEAAGGGNADHEAGDDAAGQGEGGAEKYSNERDLYTPFRENLKKFWIPDQGYVNSLVADTASGGARPDGVWARPDVTVLGMVSFPYVPGRTLDVVTFEVKYHDSINVKAVYEALSHKKAATRSFVALFAPPNKRSALVDQIATVMEEALRHSIGVLVFEDPDDIETWDWAVEAVRSDPDPKRLNDFIAAQIAPADRERMQGWWG